MPANDDTATESSRTAPAEITVEIEPATYERLQEEFDDVADEGYSGTFEGFVLSNVAADVVVEVDG
jgi:hypothetical protein